MYRAGLGLGLVLACKWLGVRVTVRMVTGQLADKPTRGLSSRGLDNSWTSQLANREFLKIMELLYFICTLNLTVNPNSNPIEYWQRINNVTCSKWHWELLYTPNFQSNISASWLVRELTRPRLDWQQVGLSVSCPVTVWISSATRDLLLIQ